MKKRGHLPKRSRYYQSMIDMALIEKGALYSELKQNFVIFICNFDLFGKNRMLYTFENICLQDKNIHLKDETTKIFVNVRGEFGQVSEELRELLMYFRGNKPSDTYTQSVEREIEKAKLNKKWRRDYMTYEMMQKEVFAEGETIGLGKGIKLAKKVLKMLEEGYTEEETARACSVSKDIVREIADTE